MRKRIWFIAPLLILVLGLFVLTSCAPAQPAEDEPDTFTGTYNFGGSTALEPIFTSAIEAFAEKHPDARVSYDAPGSTVGIQGVIDGVFSLAGASRELREEELAAGVVGTHIALDSLALIIHGEIAIDNLTLDQIARIFSGEIQNWYEVGAEDLPIVVVNRDEASGTFGAFEDLVMEEVLGDDAEFRIDAMTVASAGEVVTKVAGTPGAIGYVGFGHLDRAQEAGARYINVDNVEMTIDTVMAGEYPISRKVYAVHKGDLIEGTLEKAFVDFLLSEEGQRIVEEEGFIRLP